MRTYHRCTKRLSVYDDRWPATVMCQGERQVIDGSFHAVQNGCDEPCRFKMGKEGEGRPAFRSFDYYLGLQDGLVNKPEKS